MSRTTTSAETPDALARRGGTLWRVIAIPLAAALVAGVGGYELTHMHREPDRASIDARIFLQRYAQSDGRVVRTDQGGDTVSEGQAYAMLLAVALQDRTRFDDIWSWTKHNLQRPDGLLSWHWANGSVLDRQSAADADLDAIRALVLASRTFGHPSYEREAKRMARAVIDNETIRTKDGRVVVAGLWAVEQRSVNPSYLAVRSFDVAYAATHDARWKDVTRGSLAVIRQLMREGHLPPDWATVAPDGTAEARSSDATAYGFEAPRLLLRLAESCDGGVRSIAGGVAPAAEGAAKGSNEPVKDIGAAAAASAAGDPHSADDFFARAERTLRERPTYYGWALVALGRIALETDRLGGC